jgi:hypothetical protein
MAEEPEATIVIERPVTDGLGFVASLVVLDGRPIGRLRKGRPAVFRVPAGDHLLRVWPANGWGQPIDPESLMAQIVTEPIASIRLRLEPGARAGLWCESNQPGLHPLVWFSGGFFISFAVLEMIGRHVHAVRAAQDALVTPLLLGFLAALVLGPIGIAIWVRRAWRAKAFSGTVVSLTLRAGEGASVLPAPSDNTPASDSGRPDPRAR